jgi:hypothetical protein
MVDAPNPYQAPMVDPEPSPPHWAPDGERETQGFPGPILLAWIGVLLAIGVVASIALAGLGLWLVAFGLLIPPLRVVWVVFARIQHRHHRLVWSPGASAFLFSVWVINIILLFIDATLIYFVATCLMV